jgi:hypothetical protein
MNPAGQPFPFRGRPGGRRQGRLPPHWSAGAGNDILLSDRRMG